MAYALYGTIVVENVPLSSVIKVSNTLPKLSLIVILVLGKTVFVILSTAVPLSVWVIFSLSRVLNAQRKSEMLHKFYRESKHNMVK